MTQTKRKKQVRRPRALEQLVPDDNPPRNIPRRLAKKHARLTRDDRFMAMALIEQMLIRRFDRPDIKKAIDLKFGPITQHAFDEMVSDIYAKWRRHSEQDAPYYRESQRRSLLRLYREAEKNGDLRTCLDVERLLARLDGTLQPQKIAVATPQQWQEFDGRTPDELDFFAKHGCFPEEAPPELDAEAKPILEAVKRQNDASNPARGSA